LAGPAAERAPGLRLWALDGAGQAQEVVVLDVPTPETTSYGLRWDLAHDRALLVANGALGSEAHAFWLLDFGWETAP
jgi:hypothetical protein